MQKEDFLAKIKEIGTCEDDVARRTMLSELETEVSSVFDSNSELTESNKNLTDDNESLRAANMKLFLKVGAEKEENGNTNNNNKNTGGEPEKRKFEDLFNEKGELK